MCIAVPDMCILAESNQLIKYSSPSNSQTTEALKQKPNACPCSLHCKKGSVHSTPNRVC